MCIRNSVVSYSISMLRFLLRKTCYLPTYLEVDRVSYEGG